MFWTQLKSPIGLLTLSSNGLSITGLWMASHRALPQFSSTDFYSSSQLPVFQNTAKWLCAYFSKSVLPDFPSIAPDGTPFQQAVWSQLLTIPYGRTTTYGTISHHLQIQGISASPQAVGGAVGRNPISILIPCHRVLGADGSLTGYAGGLTVKQQLLHLEGIPLPHELTSSRR